MRKSRFAEVQIVGMINEQEAGMPMAEVNLVDAHRSFDRKVTTTIAQ